MCQELRCAWYLIRIYVVINLCEMQDRCAPMRDAHNCDRSPNTCRLLTALTYDCCFYAGRSVKLPIWIHSPDFVYIHYLQDPQRHYPVQNTYRLAL